MVVLRTHREPEARSGKLKRHYGTVTWKARVGSGNLGQIHSRNLRQVGHPPRPACRLFLFGATMPAMRILIIEDDREAASYLVKAFREAGHVADHATDGLDGYAMGREGAYDVIVVDRMLPKLDGLSLIRSLREQGVDTPVLILSALGQVDDRVKGLRAGGDDYLPKPYAFSELLARVEVLVRRRAASGTSEPTAYRVADLELDRLSHRVTRQGTEIVLQPREFRLLEFLMKNAGQVVTRTMLLEHVWDYHFDPQTNVIDVHVSRLRSKIDKGFDRPLIHTIRGAGYMVRDSAGRRA
jgi:two-component system, OmpR family, response regulator